MASTPPLASASASASAQPVAKKPDTPKPNCLYAHLLAIETPPSETMACLRPKLANGTATPSDIALLKATCKSVGDMACLDAIRKAEAKKAPAPGPIE